MKHPTKVTIYLIVLFLCAQIIGLGIMSQYIDAESEVTGEVEFKELPTFLGYQPERPEATEGQAVVYVMTALILGTILILLLIRFKKVMIWKLWFFIAIMVCLNFAFAAFLPIWLANLFAILFAYLKTWKRSSLVHNITELFVYAGLVVIFIDLFTVRTGIILLILISIYDMYAVWRSEHMVKLATFQSDAGLFAGLSLPIAQKRKSSKKTKRVTKRSMKRKSVKQTMATAVLGGGDIGFPMIFAGAVLKEQGFGPAVFIAVGATIALGLLLTFSKKNKFYPAMPFISAGMFVAFALLHVF